MISLMAAGLFVGAAVGLTGVGGGSLMTPILILAFGFAPASAVGTDLLYAAGTKAFGTWLHGRQQTVDWPVVGLMAAGSIPSALLTVAWLHVEGLEPWVQRLMLVTLCATMIVTAILTFAREPIVNGLKARLTFADGSPPPGLRLWRPVITVAGGLVLGVLVSLSSVGAGVLGTTLLLILYPRAPVIRVVGTDIAHAVPLTLVAGLGHLSLGTTDGGALGLLLAGSLPGIFLGTRAGWRLPDGVLRLIISAILVTVAASMLFKTF